MKVSSEENLSKTAGYRSTSEQGGPYRGPFRRHLIEGSVTGLIAHTVSSGSDVSCARPKSTSMTVQLSSLKPACMRYCPWELAVNRWKTLLILVLLSFPSRLGPPTWTLPARTSRTTSRWSLPDTSDKFRSPAVNFFKRGSDVIKPMGAIQPPFFRHLCENIQPLKRSPQALTGSKRTKRGQHIQIMWRAVQGSSTDFQRPKPSTDSTWLGDFDSSDL